MIKSRRYYWGRLPFNTKTGQYKGEFRYSTDGTVRDWKGHKLPTQPTTPKGIHHGKNED